MQQAACCGGEIVDTIRTPHRQTDSYVYVATVVGPDKDLVFL